MINVTVIINEHAGNGKAKKLWSDWQSKIVFPYTVLVTKYRGHAQEISQKIAERVEPQLIVILGGDGTVHEVISGIIGSEQVRIGVVSTGSGNDFGRAFSVFTTPEQLNQYVEKIDVTDVYDAGIFSLNGQQFSFVNSAGFGFDAKVSVSVNKSFWKSRLNTVGLGKLAYILLLIKELFLFRTFSTTLRIGEDRVKFDNVWFVTISNQPYYGGGMKISPKSLPNDQLFEITVVHNLSKWKLLLVFGTVFLGTHTKFKEVEQFQTSTCQLTFKDSTLAHTDGEFACGVSPFEEVQVFVLPYAWRNATTKKKELKS